MIAGRLPDLIALLAFDDQPVHLIGRIADLLRQPVPLRFREMVQVGIEQLHKLHEAPVELRFAIDRHKSPSLSLRNHKYKAARNPTLPCESVRALAQ